MHVQPLRSVLAATALLIVAPLAGGCVYRMTIQQGNFLQKHSIAQLQVGMTRSQVRYLLGTPVVPTTFDSDRWDYLYYLKKGHLQRPAHYLLTVYFRDNRVARIDNHGQAAIDSAPTTIDRAPRPAT
jgi:outer membrane protein assembly factor BamE